MNQIVETTTQLPQIDLSLTVTAIIALAAIISPVIVAILNNHHQFKMKKLEITSSQKFDVIEKYLASAGRVIELNSTRNSIEYESNKGLLYLYIPQSTWGIIDDLDSAINNNDLPRARKLLSKACKELAKTIQN